MLAIMKKSAGKVDLPGELHIHVGAFNCAADLAPSFHIYPDEQLPWLHLAEAAPSS